MKVNVQFATSFEVHVEQTAAKMAKENLDACEIPEGLGMVLVRVGSIEYQRRLDATPMIMMIPKVVSVGCHGFIVSVC